MPNQEQSHRFQTAVLWPMLSTDSYGRFVVGDPEEIKVRWVRKEQETSASHTSATSFIQAKVFVDRKITIGSNMWLGSLDNFVGTSPGVGESEVMQVIAYSEVPDLKSRASLKEVRLIRLQDSWPISAQRFDASLSSISYSKTLASANSVDPIVVQVSLRDPTNNPIVARNVYVVLSSNAHILNTSPQLTDANGSVQLTVKASAPTTPTARVQTIEDGFISNPVQLVFA